MEKDFDLYIGGDDLPGATEDQDTEGMVDAAQALDSMADTTKPAEAAPAVEEGATQPAEPAPEVTPEPTPEATEGMNEGEQAPVDETTAGEGGASMDELMKMIDSLNSVSDQSADANAEIKQAAEEIKTAAPASDDALQGKIDELIQKLADKETNELKMQKTIDILKSEYEKTLNDKISLEFGTASDSRIAQIVNEDPDVKALIAAKMSNGEDSNTKIADAWKNGWQNISGTNIDDLIGAKKDAEVDALAAMGEDSSTELNGESEEDMYI